MRPPQLMAVATALATLSCAPAPDPKTAAPPLESPSPTSFVNGGPCPRSTDPSLPSEAGCTSTVGSAGETLTVFALVNHDDKPTEWRIRLTSDAGEVERALRAGNDFSYPRAIGAADMQGDGRPEWWIRTVDYTSHGAPWSGAQIFLSTGDSLEPLKLDGRPMVVNYGGIARLGEGARCHQGRLSLLRAEAVDRINTRWKVSKRTYSIRASRARFVRRTEGTLVIRGYNDPDLDPYYRIDC